MKRRSLLIGGGALAVARAGASLAVPRQVEAMADYDAAVAATRAVLLDRPDTPDLI